MIRLLSDLIFITFAYFSIFKGIHYVFQYHLKAFKVLFDINIHDQLLNRETDVRERTFYIIFCSSTILFALCVVYSLLQTFLVLFFRAIDVVAFTRLLLILNVFKFLNFYFETKKQKIEFKLVPVILYSIINYTNKDVFMSCIFMLFDELFEIEHFLIKCDRILNKFISYRSDLITELVIISQVNKKIIKKVQALFILIIILHTFFFSLENFKMNEIYFLYYATYRLICVYQHISSTDRN